MLELKNISKQFGQHKIFDNYNLTVEEGKILAIVGPSGGGKTTLLRMLAGLETIDSGQIIYENEEIPLDQMESRNLLGFVFQDFQLFPHLTVLDNLTLSPIKTMGMSKEDAQKKAQALLDRLGLGAHGNAYPYSLSGGQKQRVTLAGVMVGDVDILLFDEPLASLDPATGKSAIELIDDIQKKTKKTILIIEHRLEDVLHCSVDRIIVVNEGKIAADITPEQLLSSNLLVETGIREPLYITALKYAGCTITPDMHPEHIDTLNIDKCRENLKKWYEGVAEDNATKTENTILEMKDVKFSYESGKEILHGVSFKVNKGEMVSIVGRNGAGKSTISKLICGFYKPTEGQILFEGRDLINDTIKERAEKIGIVMQNPNQMISKTMIFDEVALGLKVRGVSEEEIKNRVFETLKVCGLYEFRNWPISALSFGQKKRVTIASILVLNPEVIILDEPTAGQDFKHYTEIMEFLKELNKKGVTIVMITHDMHLMLEYTNRAIVLSNGLKLADDIAANVLTDKEVIINANLKETSLYELAVKANLENPRMFVKKFIDYDRRVREI